MATPLASVHHASISTSAVEERDRHAFWSDFVCARLVKVDCIDVADPVRFAGRIDQCQVDGISVSTVASHAQRVRRGPRLIAQAGEEQVLVNIQQHGRSLVRQDGRETLLEAGDMAIYASDRPYELVFDDAFAQTVVILPAADLRAFVPDFQRVTAQRCAGSHPTMALLRQATRTFQDAGASAASAPLAQVVLHAVAACTTLLSGLTPAQHPTVAVPPTHGLPNNHQAPTAEALSLREREVLQLIARGCRHAEVASLLGLSLNTVRTHLRNTYGKLGVHSNTEAIYEASALGLLS